MRKLTLATVLTSALLLAAGTALAQPPEEWAPRGRWGQLYDPRSTVTINGEVIKMEKMFRGRRGAGIHATVASGQHLFEVFLGPDWYLSQQRPRITVGDQVQVVGSRQLVDGRPAVMAAEVRRGDRVLRLRDVRTGIPLWSGPRWRGRY